VEPGHQFEWAWLLLRWSRAAPGVARQRADRLVELGETHGVHGGVAVNVLSDDLTVSDGAARLWPQTERVKAAVYLANVTREPRDWSIAASAIAGLLKFLDAGSPGLWHDRLTADGCFVSEPSPASSFYHIVGAIAELGTACA
jgi:mannose/cellobiose epimerase-like protein (N-acyl-D-glucosamine 2-epimerase family)